MKKNIKLILSMCLIVLSMTSCFKRDDLEGVDIFTTVYPIQYVTDYLYGHNSTVRSIYPAETDPDEYVMTDLKIEEYSKGAIFIYNGLSKEKGIARDLLNENKRLRIIDVSQGLEYDYSVEELWMNPRDFLMLAHNIKNGLEKYINNKYILEEINENYENLKVIISAFDAELETATENAKSSDILVASNTLSFLSKYGFTVTNIDETSDDLSQPTKTKAKKLINDKTVKYIFMLDNQEETDFIKELVGAGGTIVKLRSMTVLSEEDIANQYNYKTMMRDNLENIKREIYE